METNARVRLILVTAGVGAAVMFGACGGSDTKTVTVGSKKPPSTETAKAGTPASGGQADAKEAIKEETVAAKGGTNVPAKTQVRLAVTGLKVEGKLMTLDMQVTPVASPDAAPADREQPPNLFNLNGDVTLVAALIDPVGLRRYAVVSDSGNKALGSGDLEVKAAAYGQPADARYVFAAPPENVTKLDLQFGNWPTLTGVPVER